MKKIYRYPAVFELDKEADGGNQIWGEGTYTYEVAASMNGYPLGWVKIYVPQLCVPGHGPLKQP